MMYKKLCSDSKPPIFGWNLEFDAFDPPPGPSAETVSFGPGSLYRMPVYVGLLRAVNLGPDTQVSMDFFRDLLLALGFEGVQTLLRSGNAVFRSPERNVAKLERGMAAAIERRLGRRTEVFVRSAEEWRSVIVGNPFPREAADDPGHLLVMALRETPANDRWQALAAAIPGRERVRGSGRHAYLVFPDGIGRSRLTPARIEECLGTVGTARNWNTVNKLAALAEGTESSGSVPP